MKKIKRLLLAGALLFLAASCNDAIDIVQDGELDDEATFQTVQDLDQYLQGSVYTNLTTSTEINFTAVFTDETSIGSDNGGQGKQLHRFILNPDDGSAASLWINQYAVINRVNRLLKAAESITPEEDTFDELGNLVYGGVSTYNDILAQARMLRAYAYLQLEAFFSTNMADDTALGVMLVDFVPELNTQIPRATNAEIFALMEADWAFAEANLNLLARPALNRTYYYVTPVTLSAMRARFYLYRKNYTLAEQYAQATIAAAPALSTAVLGAFNPNAAPATIATQIANTPYRRVWLDAIQGEVIWGLSRPASGIGTEDIAGSFYFNNTSATGQPFLEMSRNLYNKLDAWDYDVRQYAFVDASRILDPSYATNPAYISTDIIPIDKYPGKTNVPLKNDLKVFRTSEMHFILAECAANAGQLGTVATILKTVRDSRRLLNAQALPLDVYATPAEAWGAILDERRKELCFEGHRYLDIKRLGVLSGKSIERDPTDDDVLGLPLTIPNDDYRFTMPIPQSELRANPLEQNPGYNN